MLGTPSTDASLWQGIDVEHVGDRDMRWLDRADVVTLLDDVAALVAMREKAVAR